jgi:hypothetical protein
LPHSSATQIEKKWADLAIVEDDGTVLTSSSSDWVSSSMPWPFLALVRWI